MRAIVSVVLCVLLIALTTAAAVRKSPAPAPNVINQTKSLEISYLGQAGKTYELRLHNSSQLAVSALILSVQGPNGVCDTHTFRAAIGLRFITPGQTSDFRLNIPGKKPQWSDFGGESCPPSFSDTSNQISTRAKDRIRSPEILLAAVDFENGTYEGDDLEAAEAESYRLGYEAERQRLSALFEKEIQNSPADDNLKISSLLDKVSAPNWDQPEPALVQSTMNGFSFLPESTAGSIQRALRVGMGDEQTLMRLNLLFYKMEVSKHAISGVSLQQWWNETKGQCDLLVPQYCEKINP